MKEDTEGRIKDRSRLLTQRWRDEHATYLRRAMAASEEMRDAIFFAKIYGWENLREEHLMRLAAKWAHFALLATTAEEYI